MNCRSNKHPKHFNRNFSQLWVFSCDFCDMLTEYSHTISILCHFINKEENGLAICIANKQKVISLHWHWLFLAATVGKLDSLCHKSCFTMHHVKSSWFSCRSTKCCRRLFWILGSFISSVLMILEETKQNELLLFFLALNEENGDDYDVHTKTQGHNNYL